MPKITSFSLKNCPVLRALPSDPLRLRRLEAMPPDPNISPILLRTHRCVLNYNRRFQWQRKRWYR